MLKSRVIGTFSYRRCLSYFSNAFNNLANQGPPMAPNKAQSTSELVNNLDLDVFINRDHRQMDLLDKLMKLRQQKECSKVPLLPNILVKQLLDDTGPQESMNVLKKPLQYGIFIDQFTGCHLMDWFLHNGNTREAAQLATLLVERDLCNNELVATLCLQSFYAYVKNYEAQEVEKVEPSKEVEKVRVKFIRNYENANVKTEEKMMSEAMIKLGSNTNLDKELVHNITLIGLTLDCRLTEAEKWLTGNQESLNKSALQVCRQLIDVLKVENTPELEKLLAQECKQTKSFDEILESCVKRCVESCEPQLMEEYEKSYQAWQMGFQLAVKEQAKIHDVQNRVESIHNTLNSLQTMRQNLWYFENKEDIDIAIYKKKVHYPKRWFGKKKKPKAVDAFYVPPTISRGN
ncbi:uncharacterized protein LOC6559250 [Drosophila grimshawi]|uniref:GH20194 n=1 Tax=Drosophila grimshawi TaxID=7222 RepID=B4J638_DROGR|nr:uncharacterized protein LOC6559250 [Drosophila grimshawi]EDW01896.1 GH20194 [Drosophila grimshawi]